MSLLSDGEFLTPKDPVTRGVSSRVYIYIGFFYI